MIRHVEIEETVYWRGEVDVDALRSRFKEPEDQLDADED